MKDGEAQWQQFVTEWHKFDPQGSCFVVLGHSYIPLREAVTCLDVDCPNATAILCRSAIETAGYHFLTRKQETGMATYHAEPPKSPSKVSFEWVKRGLVKALGKKHDKPLFRIQKDGNFVAHEGSKQDRRTAKAIGAILRGEVDSGRTPWTSIAPRVSVRKSEAERDLKDTFAIFLEMGRELKRRERAVAGAATRTGTTVAG